MIWIRVTTILHFLSLLRKMTHYFWYQIHNDYASLMWGEQPPYKESVKIVDGNKLWFVRLKKLIWALYLVMASPKLFGIVV
uniref:Uncharacterized protein n=1 Tax=Helianthus annuus TaxID=4232 RepID=A0A251U8W6_HELAN